jgi:Gene product 88
MRRLPLLADHFADRTVARAALTPSWLRSHGIAPAAGQSPEEAAEAAGYFVRDGAQLSVPANVVVPDATGESLRDRAFAILAKRSLVIGFDYASKVTQPFAIHLDPPLTKLDERYVTGGDAAVARLSAKEREALAAKRWFGRVSMLTETAKMGCFSWNLPAGPPKLGGTCPSAALGFLFSGADDAQRQGGDVLETGSAGKGAYRLDAKEAPIRYGKFICNGCYALKGNYLTPNLAMMMVVRLALVRTLLRGPGTGASAGVFFVDGDAYHRAREAGSATDEAVRAAFKAREAQEVATGRDGVRSLAWLFKTAITCADLFSRATREGRKAFAHTPAEYAEVRAAYEQGLASAARGGRPADLARQRVERTYAWAVPEPGYFRLHDSGDFFSPDYWTAWRSAIAELPGTRFWAPNRTWAHASPTVRPTEIPENLAMRPSALHFDDPPPTQATLRKASLPIWKQGGGFAAGSGSGDPSLMHKVPGTAFHAFDTAPDEPFWECPAYGYWTSGGGAVFGTEDRPAGGTCILAKGPRGEKGCRVCWGGRAGEYTQVGVVYHKH